MTAPTIYFVDIGIEGEKEPILAYFTNADKLRELLKNLPEKPKGLGLHFRQEVKTNKLWHQLWCYIDKKARKTRVEIRALRTSTLESIVYKLKKGDKKMLLSDEMDQDYRKLMQQPGKEAAANALYERICQVRVLESAAEDVEQLVESVESLEAVENEDEDAETTAVFNQSPNKGYARLVDWVEALLESRDDAKQKIRDLINLFGKEDPDYKKAVSRLEDLCQRYSVLEDADGEGCWDQIKKAMPAEINVSHKAIEDQMYAVQNWIVDMVALEARLLDLCAELPDGVLPADVETPVEVIDALAAVLLELVRQGKAGATPAETTKIPTSAFNDLIAERDALQVELKTLRAAQASVSNIISDVSRTKLDELKAERDTLRDEVATLKTQRDTNIWHNTEKLKQQLCDVVDSFALQVPKA